MRDNADFDATQQQGGIEHGIGGGQWFQLISAEENVEEIEEIKTYKKIGSSSSVGVESLETLSIQYSTDVMFRDPDGITLRELDEAMFIGSFNSSLAEKIQTIHIYANGYKIKEIEESSFEIDRSEYRPGFPVEFTPDELKDPWVRLRPAGGSSFFVVDFFGETPTRMYMPKLAQDTLKK